ncbi:probable carbohydrate esterase At4g34215 [Cannabis sativa]|uniref:probable carbohydrate esterase At4g34215 n=1 Tax=Cannabis sativa TaxID=3483 RepID=UPI0011E066C4|nr:probable carbohydrate esterase At4g34215 [Cannabis sativa]
MALCFIPFFLWVLKAHATSFDPNQQFPQKNIFILAGQSNMAGRGGLIINDDRTRTQIWDGVVPSASRPNPSVLRLNAKLSWVQAHEPLHADIDVASVDGVGPGMAFANAVLADDPSNGPIGLVPCAIGGTNISQWEKGTPLYRHMVKRARASVAADGGTIRALLWYQGESDTILKQDAEVYGRRLERLFQDIRLDLMSPMLPIIQVALASGVGPYVDTVREAQFGTELLNVRTVDPIGLTVGPDKLHLTTESQVQLGEMMADAFLKFLPKQLSIDSTGTQTTSSSSSSTIFFFSMMPLITIVISTVSLLV